MNPPPPPLLPKLFLLLLQAAALLLSWTATAQPAARCPDCGSIPVPYPLSTSPNCGDPFYTIRCDAGALVFDSVNFSYPIISVSPSNQRFVIRTAGLAPNTCVASDLVNQGLQLNTSLPFNITGSNTIMYLNCSAAVLTSPLNCSRAGLCHVYANGTASYSSCRDAPVCCTFTAGGSTTAYMIRVRESGCRAYASFVNLDPGLPVDRWPDPGVEIQWALPREPLCGSQVDCNADSNCGPDRNSSGLARCFCKNGFQWDPIQGICSTRATCEDGGHCGRTKSRKVSLIAGVVAGTAAALAAIAFAVTLQKRQRRLKQARERLARERELQILNAGGSRTAKIFSGREIKKATNNFSRDRLLGVGGYGEVYKGILNDGTTVAVKCAKLGNPKGTAQILNEVRILCQVNHKTLVGLLGCCVQLPQPVMVYEYVPNGTLLDRLTGPKTGKVKPLTWLHRLRIARDTAEGLAYLHSSVVPPVYHRDVKSSNILLNEKLNARVSDFGLSRLVESDLSHISTCAQGTLGYLDPEYYRNYQLTEKSDVYSFGVVLLEILTGLKAIDFGRGEDNVNLVVYVQRMVREGRLVEVFDPLMMVRKGTSEDGNHLEVETMKSLAFLGLSCLEEKRQNRPSMKEVTEEIEYIISVAMGSSDPQL
ncbi:unnamed protein product [Linum tenue]|uniref:Protein kinase domain-containing protein n=1 Tax=Linum tenue TaxID=586396 RepID=A0AAV0JRY4_9ROSI|nr:unnamed protein product [Linum tenue]